jgi:hypothetical protein
MNPIYCWLILWTGKRPTATIKRVYICRSLEAADRIAIGLGKKRQVVTIRKSA